MTHHPVFAASALLVHSIAGVPITSLPGSLGPACAVMVVTRYFLGFLKNQRRGQARIIASFRRNHASSQQKFQDQADRVSKRQLRNQYDFQKHVDGITDSQTTILRDAIATMNRMEIAIACSSTAIRDVETSMSSLGLTIRGIEDVLSGMTEVGG
jgi:hypothetical protein